MTFLDYEARARALFTELQTGPSAVRARLRCEPSETEILDFKRFEGTVKKLKPSVERNLGEALSGFWNSHGGVIVWGVDDETQAKETPREEMVLRPGIPEAARISGKLQRMLSDLTYPPIPGVQFEVVRSDVPGLDLLLMFVPARGARAPAYARGSKGVQFYYFRVGDQFLPMPPDFLAQLLGVRPPPICRPWVVTRPPRANGRYVEVDYDIFVENEGRSIAERPFLRIRLEQDPPEGFNVQLSAGKYFSVLRGLDKPFASGQGVVGGGSDTWLPNDTSLQVAKLRVRWTGKTRIPSQVPVDLELVAGAQDALPVVERWHIPDLSTGWDRTSTELYVAVQP